MRICSTRKVLPRRLAGLVGIGPCEWAGSRDIARRPHPSAGTCRCSRGRARKRRPRAAPRTERAQVSPSGAGLAWGGHRRTVAPDSPARADPDPRGLARVAGSGPDWACPAAARAGGSPGPVGLQVLADLLGPVTDRLHGLLQALGRHAQALAPVAQFVVLVHVDALTVLALGLGLVVGHGGSPDGVDSSLPRGPRPSGRTLS